VKATHGSGWNIVVRTAPSDEQVEDIRRQLSRWVSQTYDVVAREPHYRYVKPEFVVEPLLLQNGQPPPDYKFMIARGRVMMIQVEADRFTLHRRSIFTPDWRRLDVEFIYPPAGDLPRPSRLNEMIALAEKLGADYAWVRVDLYQQADRIYFGEITHVPEGGFLRFTPADFDRAIGDVISGRRDVGSLNSYLAR
jgi:TupA-like ATPgrasp